MIKIENVEVVGWEATIRGIRNQMNSWKKSDSGYCFKDFCRDCETCVNGPEEKCKFVYNHYFEVGSDDHILMMKLVTNDSFHVKCRSMITMYLDITAPLYWWNEFNTNTDVEPHSVAREFYKKEFTLGDFSCENLFDGVASGTLVENPLYKGETLVIKPRYFTYLSGIEDVICLLNDARELYLKTNDKTYWRQMLQLLPSSYNEKRTVMLNYEVLAAIYPMRKNDKLDEWREFCRWIERLPYSEIITYNGEGDIELK